VEIWRLQTLYFIGLGRPCSVFHRAKFDGWLEGKPGVSTTKKIKKDSEYCVIDVVASRTMFKDESLALIDEKNICSLHLNKFNLYLYRSPLLKANDFSPLCRKKIQEKNQKKDTEQKDLFIRSTVRFAQPTILVVAYDFKQNRAKICAKNKASNAAILQRSKTWRADGR